MAIARARRAVPGRRRGAGSAKQRPAPRPRRLHVRAQAVHPVPVGADDHARGDPPATGARHGGTGRTERRHLLQAARLPRRCHRGRAGAGRLARGHGGPSRLPARGQRLDGWLEWFDEGKADAAFSEMERVHGVGLPWFVYRRRRMDEVLPWDRIDCGVEKAYLQKQLAAARNLAEVPDGALAPCSVCGACDYDAVKNLGLPAGGLREGASAAPRPGRRSSGPTSGSGTPRRGGSSPSPISR